MWDCALKNTVRASTFAFVVLWCRVEKHGCTEHFGAVPSEFVLAQPGMLGQDQQFPALHLAVQVRDWQWAEALMKEATSEDRGLSCSPSSDGALLAGFALRPRRQCCSARSRFVHCCL
jgi:hypothetical protein